MPTRGSLRSSIFSAQAPAAPEEEIDYAGKNALALAQIAQVDPARAALMEQQYAARTEDSGSLIGGIWNSITQNPIVKAVTAPIGSAFTLLGNISSAAAEPFRNEKEDEADNPLVDVWQGLTGSENTTWRENLVSYGWDENSKWTTIAGLAGDVFLDPTNYLGAGGLGLGRELVTEGAATLAKFNTMEVLGKRIASEGGLTIMGRKVVEGDDIPSLFADLTRPEFEALGVDKTMIDTMTGLAAGNADRTILSSIADAKDVIGTWMGKSAGDILAQGKSLRNLPPRMVDPFGGIWKRDDLVKVFEDTARLGPENLNKLANQMFDVPTGYGVSGMVGRKAAAAVGGVRFKFGIPFTSRISEAWDIPWLGHRWQTGAIPLIPRFKIFGSGEGPVMNKMGNFFRGLSGMNRLDTAIQESLIKGDGLWKREDLESFVLMGPAKFEVAMADAGRFTEYRALFGNRGTSMFMSASYKMGGLTEHVTPKAGMWRRAGYTGMKGAQELRNAAAVKRMFRESASEFETEWAQTSHKMDKLAKSGEINAKQVNDDFIRYLEGLDPDTSKLPDFLKISAEQMKGKFPEILADARKYGASVGNIAEVYARRRSETAIKLYRNEASKLVKQIEKLNTGIGGERQLLVDTMGAEAAVATKSPKLLDLEQKLAEANAGVAKILEAQKTVEMELSMMDEMDNMIRHLRPNYPAEKAMPSSYFHRRWTQATRDAIDGALNKKFNNWGKSKLVRAQMERILADKSIEQASKIVRDMHPEALKHVDEIFETSTFGVFAAYVEDMSEAVYKSQLKKSAEHVMGLLGGVDNGLAMRANAYIPTEFAPRATKAQKALGIEPKFTNLAELIDNTMVAIGGRVMRTAHVEGTAAWANATKNAGKDMEPWKTEVFHGSPFRPASSPGDKAEYLDAADIEDLVIPVEGLRAAAETDAVAKLMTDVKLNGWKESIVLEYDPVTRGLEVANGHHRLQAAKNLKAEGFEGGQFVPTVIYRAEVNRPGGFQELEGVPAKLLDDAHRAKANFDWDVFGFVPETMSPSELFAIEAGRLGKFGGDIPEEQAYRMGIALNELNLSKAEAAGMSAIPEVAFTKVTADIDASRWGTLDIPGLEDFVMHPFLAAEFNRAYAGLKDVGEFRRNWRKFVQGPWKKSATIYFPGFHARNFVGAWFNNTLGGVRPEHYVDQHRVSDVLRYGRKSDWWDKTLMTNARVDGELVKKLTYGDMAIMQMSRGIVGGNNLVVADLQTFLGKRTAAGIRGSRVVSSKMSIGKIGTYQDELMGQVAYAEKAMREWESWGIRTTNTTESFFRGSAFMKGLEDAAGDTAGAREFVMMRHGDYAELTDFENVIRDLVPFYKWLRTNTPFQIRRLLEDPAMSLVVGDVQNALIPEKDRKRYVSYVKNEFNIPMPAGLTKLLGGTDGGGILVAQLPLHDLFNSSSEFASSFLPVVKNLFENNVLHRSIFTGSPIDNTHKTEGAGWMHTTGLAQAMAMVGMGQKGEGGKVFFSTSEMNYLNIFPIFARSKAFMIEDPDRKSMRMAALISAVSGFRPESTGPTALNEGEREWYYDVLEPQVEELKALGYPLPSAYDLGVAVNSNTGNPFQ